MQLYPNSLWIVFFYQARVCLCLSQEFLLHIFLTPPQAIRSLCVYLQFSINVTEQQNILSFNFKSLSQKSSIIMKGFTRLNKIALTTF